MLIINGKAMLKIGNRYIAPGEEVEIPDALAAKLKTVGLVESAMVEQEESAMIPKPTNKITKTRKK